MNRTAIVCMLVLLAIPRLARSQPADAGVADVAAPPDAAVPPPPPPRPPAHETRPRIVNQQPPIYPDVATKKAVDVVVHVDIDDHGTPTGAHVASEPNAAFDDLAVAAVLSWTFSPATRDGTPIASHLDVTVHFDPGEPVVPTTTGETIELHGDMPAGRIPPPSVGAQDIRTDTKQLVAAIPHASSTQLLQWAPGFLLTNEGGEGHAEQIFLRGFDAREGQDIEIRVAGDVVNQAGNLHGNGYSDLHFVIPELVQSIRVVEGPYDPRQGNFAVAGSADYELGLTKRGLAASYELGSFGTRRALLLWGPPEKDEHTFGGVELYHTDGYGRNRDADRATALGQYEGSLGHGIWRVTTGAYATEYHSAGVVREDDYAAGRKGFYDTYDFGQGGSATRAFVIGDIETHHEDTTYKNELSLTAQTMRLREDFTGFLLDQQTPFQQAHAQRGDLIDLESDAITAQAQGFGRRRYEIEGLPQNVELGYFARVDRTTGQQYRVQASNDHPYYKEADLDSTLGDVGLYAAVDAHVATKLALRGGVRTDLFSYDVIDSCAVHDVAHPSRTNPPGDASCLSQQDFGAYREPIQRATTASSVVLPRASVVVGPFTGITGSLSFGDGVRSIDPSYITQDVKTPFASIRSYDAGIVYEGKPNNVETVVRLSGFRTHVDKDLIFSESVGRNVLANGTTRLGASLSGRVTGSWFDNNASVTIVRSTFDDTGLLIPYVPDLVVRTDSVVFGELPWLLTGKTIVATGGTGVTLVGPRALPFGERSDTIFTIDASANLRWDRFTVGVDASNLLNTKYRLGEFNYASDFHSQGEPTLAIARQFTAGSPRVVLVKLGVTL